MNNPVLPSFLRILSCPLRLIPNPYLLIPFLLMIAAACGSSQDRVRSELKIILDDDLETIVSELPDTAVSDSPHYEITEFKHFPKDERFSYKAVVDFYYFKSIRVKQVRKYRYMITQRKWDRYLCEYKNLPDSLPSSR